MPIFAVYSYIYQKLNSWTNNKVSSKISEEKFNKMALLLTVKYSIKPVIKFLVKKLGKLDEKYLDDLLHFESLPVHQQVSLLALLLAKNWKKVLGIYLSIGFSLIGYHIYNDGLENALADYKALLFGKNNGKQKEELKKEIIYDPLNEAEKKLIEEFEEIKDAIKEAEKSAEDISEEVAKEVLTDKIEEEIEKTVEQKSEAKKIAEIFELTEVQTEELEQLASNNDL